MANTRITISTLAAKLNEQENIENHVINLTGFNKSLLLANNV